MRLFGTALNEGKRIAASFSVETNKASNDTKVASLSLAEDGVAD